MRLILLFASQPLYGQVLPGLVPPLQPFQGAMLYHAMLRDQLAACEAVKDATLRICFAPGLLPGSFEGDLQWEIQRGESLEDRLGYAFMSAFKTGGTRVLAIGHEAFFQPATALEAAFEALEGNSLVFGPGLVGFRRHLPSMLKVGPHLYRGMAVAFSLKHAILDGSLSFESLPELSRNLGRNPAIAPISAMTLASIA